MTKENRDAALYEICLRIKDERELYHPLDESCRMLSEEVLDYITRQYEKKGLEEEIVFRIRCDGPVEEERVKNAFEELIVAEEIQNAKQKRINRVKQLWLFCVGVLFVTAAIVLERFFSYSTAIEIVSIVGSFAVWEAANIWIVENPKSRLRKHLLRKLKATRILIEENLATVPSSEDTNDR